MIEPLDVVIVVVTLLFSALFSGTEIAFLSANKLKIELKGAQGDPIGQHLSHFLKVSPRVITTILVGNNIALVIYSIAAGKLLTDGLVYLGILQDPEGTQRFAALAISTIVSTFVILFLGEYVPKAFFRLKADAILFSNFTVGFLRFFYVLFAPIVLGINTISHFFLKKILRLRYQESEIEFKKEDLQNYVQESMISLPESEQKPEIDAEMFTNAMGFNETRVKDFMVPRTEIQSAPVEMSIDALIDLFTETGYSKIIIYKDSLDEVLGFVHSTTLFRQPRTIEEALQPVLMVPESMPAHILLTEFSKYRKTIAIVVDEFGGTAGLVTVEDLVEEVFGDIEDEHDEPEEEELLAKRLDENTWLFSARHDVDDLNAEYGIQLPEGDYNTLGGLVIHFAEAILAVNDSIEVEGYRFTVTEAEDNKVNVVKVQRLD